MSAHRQTNTKGKPVAVVVGATSKWQSDGRNTRLAHGKALDDSSIPVGARWGVGGAIAQKFAQEGCFVVLTTRTEANASALAAAIHQQGGDCTIVELDLSSQELRRDGIRYNPPRRRRSRHPDLQRGIPGRTRSAAREGAARIHPGRDVRRRAAHCQPRSVPCRQGSVAGDAAERGGVVLLLQQLQIAARDQTKHRRVAATIPAS